MTNEPSWTALHQRHPRLWRDNRFVYPVLSRRSAGLSIGVNLNPDKICNFDCIYCQVDRREEALTRFVETDRLFEELEFVLKLAASGAIFDTDEFRSVPADRRRLNDIAFSGDGEPTSFRNFDDIVTRAAALKRDLHQTDVKLVLITNASLLHRPHVQRALQVLDENQGEIWAKLEAGTEAYFQLIDRTAIPFRRVVDNITAAARQRPIVIQSCFMRVHGEPPSASEVEAFCDRLCEIVAAQGRLSLIQIYTVSRPPTESFVTALTEPELATLAHRVRERTGLRVQTYGSQS